MGEARRRQMAENVSHADTRPGLRADDEITRPLVIDHEERARKFLEEIRPTLEAAEDFHDKFYAEAPPGWDYNWKRWSVYGKEDPQYLSGLMRTGWRPVPSNRHRNLLYPEYNGESIIVDGNILMERPMVLTEQQRAFEKANAEQQVKSKIESAKEAPPGTAPRGPGAHPDLPSRIKTHIGPMSVPE